MSPPTPRDAPPALLVIEAGRPDGTYLRDLWRYRELFFFLTWRDVLVRYKHTALGVAWALLRPVLTMGVFSLLFGRVAHLPSEGLPYPVFVLAATLPWQFFATAVAEASASLLGNANLLTKIYFPRLIVPASAVLTGLLDFFVSAALLGAVALAAGVRPGARLLALPLLFLMLLGAAGSLGVWLAALTVRYRDFRHVVPFAVQLGLYASPVGYSSAIVPERWQLLYALNPMVAIIDGFRWTLGAPAGPHAAARLAIGAATILTLGLFGLRSFRATERRLADVI